MRSGDLVDEPLGPGLGRGAGGQGISAFDEFELALLGKKFGGRCGPAGHSKQSGITAIRWHPAPCRAQDQPADEIGVSTSSQLRHGAAHRVAGHDCGVDTEQFGQSGDIIGNVFETEPFRGTDTSAVASVIEGYDMELLAQRLKHAEPVEGTGDRPPMQQDDRGSIGRPGNMVDIGGSAARQFECLPLGEWRTTD